MGVGRFLYGAAVLSAAAWSAAIAAQAPVSIAIETEQSEFLIGEPVRAAVLISNIGSIPYIVDDYAQYTNNFIEVYLKSKSGRTYFPDGKIRELNEIMVPQNDRKKIIFDLRDMFPNIKEGQYYVQAAARSADGSATSQVRSFSIIPGIEVLPPVLKSRASPSGNEFLEYSLVSWNRRGESTLFLRVRDKTRNRPFAFAKVGTFVTMSKPTLSFPEDDILRITHQVSRDDFIVTRLHVEKNSVSLISREAVKNPASIQEAIAVREVEKALEARDAREKKRRRGFLKRVNVSSQKVIPDQNRTFENKDGGTAGAPAGGRGERHGQK